MDKILAHCFAGCQFEDVRKVLGINGTATKLDAQTPKPAPSPKEPPEPQRLPSGKNVTVYHYPLVDGTGFKWQ